jgi:hypothetical protein
LKLDWAALTIIDDTSNKSIAKEATNNFNLERDAIFLTKIKSIYVVINCKFEDEKYIYHLGTYL